jgi:hypothetical protein
MQIAADQSGNNDLGNIRPLTSKISSRKNVSGLEADVFESRRLTADAGV